MPQQAWSSKRERQYDHIKQGLKKRGKSEKVSEEIAARLREARGEPIAAR